MFEMHSFWPESYTFRDSKDLDFEEYRRVIQDPIALDNIKSRLDYKNSQQVRILNYLLYTYSHEMLCFHLFSNFS